MFKSSGLEGKVVLVTGGSRGIGEAIVEFLAQSGAHVNFLYKNNQAAVAALECALRGQNLSIQSKAVDITRTSECVESVEAFMDQWGRIDVLINNAGIVRDNLLVGLEDKDIQQVLETN